MTSKINHPHTSRIHSWLWDITPYVTVKHRNPWMNHDDHIFQPTIYVIHSYLQVLANFQRCKYYDMHRTNVRIYRSNKIILGARISQKDVKWCGVYKQVWIDRGCIKILTEFRGPFKSWRLLLCSINRLQNNGKDLAYLPCLK